MGPPRSSSKSLYRISSSSSSKSLYRCSSSSSIKSLYRRNSSSSKSLYRCIRSKSLYRCICSSSSSSIWGPLCSLLGRRTAEGPPPRMLLSKGGSGWLEA